MKNVIEYFYNFTNIVLHKKDKSYYFYIDNYKYTFSETNRVVKELIEISKMTNNSRYNKIIFNINNMPTTYYNNKNYILIKEKYSDKNIAIGDIFNKNNIVINNENIILLRNNWIDLIGKKVDYFEYQMEHIKGNNIILSESLNYYIGLCENSILYLHEVGHNYNNQKYNNYVISHKRITDYKLNTYYNPTNIVIDHSSRDVSEYLKTLFLNNDYDLSSINNIIGNLKYNSYEYGLLFARMLFPSFYFDEYEKVVNCGEDSNNLIKIIKRSGEYENYLSSIHKVISKYKKIPKIDWI